MRGGFRRWKSRVMVVLLVVATVVAVLPLFLILGTLILKGAGASTLPSLPSGRCRRARAAAGWCMRSSGHS